MLDDKIEKLAAKCFPGHEEADEELQAINVQIVTKIIAELSKSLSSINRIIL